MAPRINRSPKVDTATKVEAPALDPALANTSVATIPTTDPTRYTEPEEYTGFEDTTADDIKVPFLAALQDLSPQIKAGPKQVPGARAGMLYDSLTGEMFDGAVGLVGQPIIRIREEQEWIPRKKGGGLVARHNPKDPAIAALRKAKPYGKATIGDNELVQTAKLYFRYKHPVMGEWRSAIVPFSSSNMDAFQTWYSKAMALKFDVVDKTTGQPVLDEHGEPQRAIYPMFAHRWVLRTVFHTKGEQSWYKLSLSLDGASAEEARVSKDSKLYAEAKQFQKMIVEGKVSEDTEAGDTIAKDEVESL